MGTFNLTEKRLKNIKESAVSDHRLQCDCVISFDDFDVLASDAKSIIIKILEFTMMNDRRFFVYYNTFSLL